MNIKNLYDIPVNEMVFFGVGGFVAGFSDILLNDLSRFKESGKIITSLRPYFNDKPILICALYALITIMVAMIIVSTIFRIMFGTFYPKGFIELFVYILIAYPLGYVMDKMIERFNIFGKTLKPYYKEAGSGHWGALALIVAIIPSFFASYGISFCKKELNTCMRDVISKI